jgi:hypothetical protein
MKTPPTAMTHPAVTSRRAGGICSTFMNIFSPGGTNPKNSSASESSASCVDPDVAERIVEEGIAETTASNVDTLEDPNAGTSDIIKESGDNSTEVAPLDGEFDNEHIVITIKMIKTNASSEEVTHQNKAITEATADDPPEDLTAGIGDEWTTVIDRKTKRKNKKARKNKEHKQRKQAKLLRQQARHGPAWAQQGGVLPASSGSGSGSPRNSSSDSNQNSQTQEIHEDGSNSNGLPGEQGRNSDTESRDNS